jgi:hypothetical protein
VPLAGLTGQVFGLGEGIGIGQPADHCAHQLVRGVGQLANGFSPNVDRLSESASYVFVTPAMSQTTRALGA